MNEVDRAKPEQLAQHKKVVFLDIDGVIFGKNGPNLSAIQSLRDAVEEHHAEIIISSTWRIGNWRDSRSSIVTMLSSAGWENPPIIGRTPDFVKKDSIRGDEIQWWLDRNPTESYVILDDDLDFLPHQIQHLVQVDPLGGIKDENIELLNQILSAVK